MTVEALGVVYRCPVCGAEITVVARRMGNFHPRCCATAMRPTSRRAPIYHCEICGAELAWVHRTDGKLEPVCCNQPMQPVPVAA